MDLTTTHLITDFDGGFILLSNESVLLQDLTFFLGRFGL